MDRCSILEGQKVKLIDLITGQNMRGNCKLANKNIHESGYVSQVDNADSAEFQLGIMRNIEYEMSKRTRQRFKIGNWWEIIFYLIH